jgi:hypothetical protein
MAKKKQWNRRFGEVLADMDELRERYGVIAHFLSLCEDLFEQIRAEHPNLKKIAAMIEESHKAALEAHRGMES